jgi:hypothetical protein
MIREQFVELAIRVPPAPVLENAMAYHGQARWMAMYWEPGGDEAVVSDGQTSFTSEWDAYLMYTRHFYRQLAGHDFGSSDGEAREWLLIDRFERKAYAAPVKAARAFLAEQWPKSEPVHLSEEQWDELCRAIAAEMKTMKPPSPIEMAAMWNEHQAALAVLLASLNVN